MVDKAPPNSGQPSSILAQLKVDITCAYHEDDAMCAAMGALLSGLSLFGPLAESLVLLGLG